MQNIRYELKYCERCGSLRLRRSDSAETYCQPCEQALFTLPAADFALRSKLLQRRPRPAQDAVPPLRAAGHFGPCGRLQ